MPQKRVEEALNHIIKWMDLSAEEVVKRAEVLNALEKNAIHQIQEGQIEEAIIELQNIIDEYRRLQLFSRAEALEIMITELKVKSKDKVQSKDDLPLTEQLKIDPELEEQLLSYRTQKIIKLFVKNEHRKAVEEFTTIVNEYKRGGRLDIVEMLEVWFNLFITKMYLVPLNTPQSSSPPSVVSKISILPTSEQTYNTLSKIQSDDIPSNDTVFKEKISKIKTLLKNFEDSLSS